jgi:sugar phosphate isomerase/epimerase
MNKLINSPQNLGTTPPLEYIDATTRAGYEAIGIRLYRAPGRTYNFNPIVGHGGLMRDVKSALASSGLEVFDIYSFYLRPEMEWDLIMPALDFGGELGARYVLVIGDDPEWQRMGESFARLCEKIAPMGQVAVLEATVGALSPLSVAVKFMADCTNDNIGLCMDPRQTFRDEHTFETLKAADPALFPYAQINDTSPLLGNAGTLPGEGVVPLYEYLDALPAGLPLSVEAQIPKGDVYSGAEWAKISVERIRRFLEGYAASRPSR